MIGIREMGVPGMDKRTDRQTDGMRTRWHPCIHNIHISICGDCYHWSRFSSTFDLSLQGSYVRMLAHCVAASGETLSLLQDTTGLLWEGRSTAGLLLRLCTCRLYLCTFVKGTSCHYSTGSHCADCLNVSIHPHRCAQGRRNVL